MLSYRKGITLIELLIAITITMVIVIAAASSFTQLLKKYRLSTVTNDLYYQLQLAKSEAIKRNQNVIVSFTTGSNWCYGINATTACNCITPSSCTISSKQADNNGISLTLAGLSGTSITFEPLHGSASANATVTFSDNSNANNYARVTIGRFGTIQSCQSDGNGAC